MPRFVLPYCTVWFLFLLFSSDAVARIEFQTENLRLVINEDGTLASVQRRGTDTEYIRPGNPRPLAFVYRGGRTFPVKFHDVIYAEDLEAPLYRGGKTFPVSEASLKNGRLRLHFAEAKTTAIYQVTETSDYLCFQLVTLQGEPIDRIDLVLDVRKLSCQAPWINANYSNGFGFCFCAGNVKTNAGMNQHDNHLEMRVMAEKGVALLGTRAVLFGFERDAEVDLLDPQCRFLDAMEIVERDMGLPPGAKNRRFPMQRYSYFWAYPTPANIDQYVDYARRAGFRIMMLSYNAFSRGAGTLAWNRDYPRGMADLKKVTDTIRAAGMAVGLHLHHPKAARNDAYVTPVPDDRFHKVRRFTLAESVGADTTTLTVHENPAGCTLEKDRRLLQLGKELITYADYTTRPPYRFLNCCRGYLKTESAAHEEGSRIGLLNVDTWVKFIRYDQNTDIQDEVARRIAKIYRETGPYAMVYFDGAEDVHEPYWYHVPHSQYRVWRELNPRPVVCEAACNMHFSWHMNTRSNAYDCFDRPKHFCRRIPFRAAPARRLDFTRINFGWLGPQAMTPESLEYCFSRAAAWDCPASIHVRARDLAANPHLDDCLATIRLWEEVIAENRLSQEQKTMLRTLDPACHRYLPCYLQREMRTEEGVRADASLSPNEQEHLLQLGQEHHLFINEKGDHELVALDEISRVADGAVKAYCFRRDSRPNDIYVLAWATGEDVTLTLDVPSKQFTAMRPFGKVLSTPSDNGRPLVSIGGRVYLVFSNIDSRETERVMQSAK